MLNIFNINWLQQTLTQNIPSSTINIKATMRVLFDESFPLETREITDVLSSTSTISTLLNDVLAVIVTISSELPNFFASVMIVFIFSKLYSNFKDTNLSSEVLLMLKNMILFNTFCFFVFFGIRSFLLVLPFYYQTTYWLNPAIRSFFLNNDLVWNNLLTSLLFLGIFALLHIFIFSTLLIKKNPSEVYILTYIIACFSWVLLEVTDFALFIICLEGFSLSLYILATTGRTYGGVSAATKYFVFGTLGSIFLYWGSLCIFEISGTMSLNYIKELTYSASDSNDLLKISPKLMWAQSLILLGFLIKLGAAPLHQWVIDVYSGVPMFITAFYSTFVKLVLFILFLRFATEFTSTKEVEYAAIFSLIIGCFGTLRQVEIKRFLAYSSITHTGYLLMGDLSATYIYLVTYLLASLMFFSVLINFQLNSKEPVYLTDLRFVGQLSSPLPRVILTVSLASMAGLPPFAGFYGKMSVWMSLIEDIYLFNDLWSYLLFTANILTSLVAMFYYAQVMCILFVNNESVTNTLTTFTISKTLLYIQIVGVTSLTAWTIFMPYFLTLLQDTL